MTNISGYAFAVSQLTMPSTSCFIQYVVVQSTGVHKKPGFQNIVTTEPCSFRTAGAPLRIKYKVKK